MNVSAYNTGIKDYFNSQSANMVIRVLSDNTIMYNEQYPTGNPIYIEQFEQIERFVSNAPVNERKKFIETFIQEATDTGYHQIRTILDNNEFINQYVKTCTHHQITAACNMYAPKLHKLLEDIQQAWLNN